MPLACYLMADDLQNYKLQLQHVLVETALLADSENEGLLRLKRDLEEVIELTRDLIKTQLEEQRKSAYVEPSASKATCDEIEAAVFEAEKLITPGKTWNIGGKCQAKWAEQWLMWCCWHRLLGLPIGPTDLAAMQYGAQFRHSGEGFIGANFLFPTDESFLDCYF
uniref:Uncharacterized protein n=1 Tax=Glossina austeni TaxID=7395 RepID=A0A1A9VH44_GLOAU